jgi:hypothetical protein
MHQARYQLTTEQINGLPKHDLRSMSRSKQSADKVKGFIHGQPPVGYRIRTGNELDLQHQFARTSIRRRQMVRVSALQGSRGEQARGREEEGVCGAEASGRNLWEFFDSPRTYRYVTTEKTLFFINVHINDRDNCKYLNIILHIINKSLIKYNFTRNKQIINQI